MKYSRFKAKKESYKSFYLKQEAEQKKVFKVKVDGKQQGVGIGNREAEVLNAKRKITCLICHANCYLIFHANC